MTWIWLFCFALSLSHYLFVWAKLPVLLATARHLSFTYSFLFITYMLLQYAPCSLLWHSSCVMIMTTVKISYPNWRRSRVTRYDKGFHIILSYTLSINRIWMLIVANRFFVVYDLILLIQARALISTVNDITVYKTKRQT